LNSSENRERELYEELIDRAVKSLLEIRNALWIYDFEEAYTLANETIKGIDGELRRVGLSIDALRDRARSVKMRIRKGEVIETPGHEVTILAPIILELTRIRKQAYQIMQMQKEGIFEPPKRLDHCAILNVDEIYLAHCWLQKPLIAKGESGNNLKSVLEDHLIRALNPIDLEVNIRGTAIEATAWLQNMVIDISIVGSRLEIRILASPKARRNIENTIEKIYSLIKSLISSTE